MKPRNQTSAQTADPMLATLRETAASSGWMEAAA